MPLTRFRRTGRLVACIALCCSGIVAVQCFDLVCRQRFRCLLTGTAFMLELPSHDVLWKSDFFQSARDITSPSESALSAEVDALVEGIEIRNGTRTLQSCRSLVELLSAMDRLRSGNVQEMRARLEMTLMRLTEHVAAQPEMDSEGYAEWSALLLENYPDDIARRPIQAAVLDELRAQLQATGVVRSSTHQVEHALWVYRFLPGRKWIDLTSLLETVQDDIAYKYYSLWDANVIYRGIDDEMPQGTSARLPALCRHSYVECQQKQLACRALSQTLIAIRRYCLEHGDNPLDADSLVPEFLSERPVDAFSGHPLRWSCTESSIRVLSVGDNRMDDSEFYPSETQSASADCDDIIVEVPR